MANSEDRPLADALVGQSGRHDDAGMPIGNDLMNLEASLDEPAAQPHVFGAGAGIERDVQTRDRTGLVSLQPDNRALGIFGRCQLAHRDERGDILDQRRPCPCARIR